MPTRPPVAAALLALALCTACGQAPSGPPPAADGDPSPAREAEAEPVAASPQDAALAFYDLVGQAQFGAACQRFAPATQQAILRAGKDCATELADGADADKRAELQEDLRTVQIDAAQVEIAGDTARIPFDAFVVPGKEGTEHAFESVSLVRQGGAWYVVSD